MGKKLSDKNRLSLTNPELCKEWDFEKNLTLQPEDVSYGSKKKVWWWCSVCSHSWCATVNSRTNRFGVCGCPACSGNTVSDKNRLSTIYPELSSQWDFEKNFPLGPGDVSFGSEIKVGWFCSVCGCKWDVSVNSRTNKKNPTGCPACCGIIVSDHNRLSLLYPKVASEWDYRKNEPLTPENISFSSHKKVWWVCKTGHSWAAIVKNRTRNGVGCPVCSGRTVTDKNRLSITHPEVSAEWDYEKNYPLRPQDVAKGSNKGVWWNCLTCGISWLSVVNNRTGKISRNCPVCSKGPVSKISQEWLETVNIFEYCREVYLPEFGIRVDGFDPETNTVYEFLGDFWHGNPNRFASYEVNPCCKKTFGELFDETIERLFLLRRSGYNLEIIWEEDFRKLQGT